MMRKGYDDFMILLVVVFIILILLFLLTPFLGPIFTQPEETSIANFTIGSVGFVTDTATRTEPLGDMRIGESQFETLKLIYSTTITQGLFGTNSEKFTLTVPEYLKDSMRGVRISFTVRDTNQYGDLKVLWNGKEFFAEKVPVGTYDVFIDKDFVVTNNEFEIAADGPGAFFWASTAYELRDTTINVEYGPSRLVSFDLRQSELEAWSKGEISFFATGRGTLTIRVNGIQIFADQSLGYGVAEFEFSDAPLSIGSNIISFSVPDGVINLQNTQLDIFLLSNEIIRTRSFDLSEEQFKELEAGTRKGVLRYYIERTNRDGVLTIEAKGILVSEHPKLGWNTAEFDASRVQEGTNLLKFSGTGNWDITDVQIVLA